MRQPPKKVKFSKMGALYANPGRWEVAELRDVADLGHVAGASLGT